MKMSDNFYLPVSVFAEHSGPENLPSHMLFNYRKFAFYTGECHMKAAAHAINHHDELVEALEIALESAKNDYACGEDFVDHIEAILNKAKGIE